MKRHVLSISTDRRLTDQASEAYHRQEAYRQAIGDMTVLVVGGIPQVWARAIEVHRQHPFDAVTSQDAFRTGLIAWRLSRRLGIPWVAQVHTDVAAPAFRWQSARTFAHWLCARFLLSRAHLIRAVSERAAHGIRRWVGDSVPVVVLPLAWRPEQVRTNQSRHGSPTVLMASRLTTEKRMYDGLGAFALVRERISNAKLFIAGDGPLRSQLETRANKPDLAGSVTFLGWREDIAGLMRESSVFMLCSAFEGYPRVITESLAAGCPVVMTDVGSAGELVRDGVSGFVVPIGDTKLLANRLIYVLSNPERAHRLGVAGLEAIASLPTFSEYVQAYAALFRQ